MKKAAIILLHALIGWAWCGAIMGIGPLVMSMHMTLIVHAIGGPLGFGLLSAFYHRKFKYTSPLRTAMIFTGFVVVMDVFVVALLIEKSFAMFGNPLGTWIPFGLIFCVSYLAGRRAILNPQKRQVRVND